VRIEMLRWKHPFGIRSHRGRFVAAFSRPVRRLVQTKTDAQVERRFVNIFVGNLDYQTTQDQLQAAFAQYGSVDRVNIVTDRDTGQPRGFAFVEMADSREAKTAIERLNGFEINGRAMNVNEARPRTEGGGGNRRGGGFGRGRGPRW